MCQEDKKEWLVQGGTVLWIARRTRPDVSTLVTLSVLEFTTRHLNGDAKKLDQHHNTLYFFFGFVTVV